ncbi:phosphodiester glycosidase family protein [Solirubrobacter phytolaccae]|uniref:Phosphodiester glycosidase family protein n=1 Tax=Solirubrobacter phytolaccae TaxID=1404360 RepID=A0A9X3NED0_9ACTN|nr:phosphodiester glycosidase family protein [Solirubrobacter phytolaccae]MDA0184546.1 phosphodiester glycosidase family protein [Solirubrobacter phytolaccae]
MLKRTLSLAAVLTVLAPSLASADNLALIDKTEPLGPGITLRHLKTVEADGWYDHQILEIDLGNPVVKSDSLWTGSIAGGGPVSGMVNKAGAVAGVNGDYFDIDFSNAPLSGQIMGGTLLKGTERNNPDKHVGVSKDGIAQLVDMALEASATFKGATHKVLTLNSPNRTGVPANTMQAFTSAWGTYSRARALPNATDVAEVLVVDNKVVSVNATGIGSGAIPANGFVLVGNDTAADAIRTLTPGDDATLTYGLKNELSRNLQFSIGGRQILVQNGVARPDSELEAVVNPRTAIGFKNGGRTLLLVTADGRQAPVLGVSLRQLARTFVELGAETALNLDGGGSTTMVARALGDETALVRNSPSDGRERNDPNGVGVFVAPGSGKPEALVLTPEEPRVFPGLHRTLQVKAIDDHQTPVAVGDVGWLGATNGRVTAPEDAANTILKVRAGSGMAAGEADVQVLGKLNSMELSTTRLTFADATSAAQTLKVVGRDAQGYSAPIEPADFELEYDATVIKVEPVGDGLKVTPLKGGGTTLIAKAAGLEARVAVTTGIATTTVHTFDNADELSRWTPLGTDVSAQTLSMQDGKLKLTYKAKRNQGITLKAAAPRINLPGQPLRVRVRLWSEQALRYAAISYVDSAGTTTSPLADNVKPGWNSYTWAIPATTKFPIRLTAVQVIETTTNLQKDGSVIFDKIEFDASVEVDSPPLPALVEDPLFSADGSATGDWSFATLSDLEPASPQAGIAAVQHARAADPDLIVLNGDIADRATLQQGGCDLIPAGGAPDDNPQTTPCYYVPGDRESAAIEAWKVEFGTPYRTFDHKGTRFVLLNSALGSLRGSGWAQLPMLDAALKSAATDGSIDNVLVFAHHPTNDPGELHTSQLAERTEVELIEKLLTDFRETSDKGVAMVGAHAQIANVARKEGVPYVVLPSSGKAPAGTPDRGGFTGWMKWTVDRSEKASQQWLTGDVRAFAQSATLQAPGAVRIGDTAQLEGTIVQPTGVLSGSRVVPLRYPMSVRWSGSDNLAIGTDVAAAKATGKAAILDPRTRKFTALKSGEVTVTVTVDSLREYTGAESLAPITTSKVIQTQVGHVGQDTIVGGGVAATLALALGTAPTFGTFVPGVTREYDTTTTATVTSSAGDAALTVSDPGFLANGTFTLTKPLQVSGLPKAYAGPVVNDVTTIGFKQAIDRNDGLRAGVYSKTLTFTLSTTQP